MNPVFNGFCDEDFWGLGKDPVPRQTVTNCLKRIGRNSITYKNALPPRKRALLLQRQVKHVEDIFFTRDTATLGMSRREVVQIISYIVQASSYFQA